MVATFFLSAVTLVSGGAPKASIVVPDRPTANERFAAGELQYWVEEITGAKLPVAEASARPAGARVHIGRRLAEGAFDGDLKALEGTEGFAVREKDGHLWLFGAKPCGNCFAAYDLLERNTDVIWPSCAKGVDRVFTPCADLAARDVGYRRIPAMATRSWSISNGYFYNDPRTERYVLRLKADSAVGTSARRKAFGFDGDDWYGHNICQFLPWDALHETHPEYFCMVDGVRMKGGYRATGTCYTSPGAVDEVAKNFMRDRIEGGQPCETAGLGIEDANQECCCPGCLEPIPLPDGTRLRKEDDRTLFCTALYYRWFNRVAAKVAARYPNFRLNTFAYMFTTDPPPFRLHPNAVVNYCAIGKDARRPFDDPANATAMRQLEGWSRLCPAFSVYEYWGCGAAYPRPVSYVVQKDLRIMLAKGVVRTGSEWVHRNGAEYVSALDFWVTNRLLWDPEADIEKLRDTFFSRAFREAAAEMRVFYDIVRDSWFRIPGRSAWSENPVDEMAFLLKDRPAAKRAFAALASAERKATHPASRLLVSKIREVMEGHRAKAAKAADAARAVEIPLSADPLSLASPEGTGWATARTLGASEFGGAPLEATLANDGEALWFRLRSEGAPETGRNIWLSDHWEVFLATAAPPCPYFHFAVDADGGSVSARAFGVRSDVTMSVISVQKNADGWRAVVKVPLEGLGVKDGALKLMLVHRDGRTQENVGWRGGEWHEPATFVKVRVGKKGVGE